MPTGAAFANLSGVIKNKDLFMKAQKRAAEK